MDVTMPQWPRSVSVEQPFLSLSRSYHVYYFLQVFIASILFFMDVVRTWLSVKGVLLIHGIFILWFECSKEPSRWYGSFKKHYIEGFLIPAIYILVEI